MTKTERRSDQTYPTRRGPLSDAERVKLHRLQRQISSANDRVRAAGSALRIIHEERLYREDHASFKDYLAEVWSMSPAQGYRLMHASQLHEVLSPDGDIPEAVLREFSGMADDEAKALYDDLAQAGRITASRVRSARTRTTGGYASTRVEHSDDLLDRYASAVDRTDNAVARLELLHGEAVVRLEREAIAHRCGAQLNALRDRIVKVVQDVEEDEKMESGDNDE